MGNTTKTILIILFVWLIVLPVIGGIIVLIIYLANPALLTPSSSTLKVSAASKPKLNVSSKFLKEEEEEKEEKHRISPYYPSPKSTTRPTRLPIKRSIQNW